MTSIHRRMGGGTAFTLGLAAMIAACAGPTGSAGTGAGSPLPAQTGGAIGASPGPPSTTTGNSAGAPLTTTFVRDETKGPAEFGLTEAEIIRRVDATEGLIAQCMTAAGFEYVPMDYATARAAMEGMLKQLGFGIATLYAGPGTKSILSAGKRNDEYKTGLSTADRVAYDRTLYGENPNYTFIVALDREDFSQVGGCIRAAVHLIFTTEEVGANFVNAINLFEKRVDADPRVIAVNKDWSNCMRQAGYPYNNPGEIDADLAARLANVTGGAAPDVLSEAAKTALTALQGEERALAALDHECDLKYVADIKAKVENELRAQP